MINVASMAGLLPAAPGGAVYSASKAYVLSLTDTLAVEAARHGVRVTAVLPGYVRTDMTRSLQEKGAPDIAFVPRERVVTDSLRGWASGRTRVVPGAQYKAVNALLHALPQGCSTRSQNAPVRDHPRHAPDSSRSVHFRFDRLHFPFRPAAPTLGEHAVQGKRS